MTDPTLFRLRFGYVRPSFEYVDVLLRDGRLMLALNNVPAIWALSNTDLSRDDIIAWRPSTREAYAFRMANELRDSAQTVVLPHSLL